jgi:transcription initiation factor TFIID subunit 12
MAQANSAQMIRPDAIDRLPFLPDDKKQYYKNGLSGLWNTYENSPEGSQQRIDAEAKIRGASQKLMTELKNHSNKMRPGSGGGGQGQPQQRPPTQGSMNGQASGMAQQQGGGQQQGANQLSGQAQSEIRALTIHVPHNVTGDNIPRYKQHWMQQAATILRQRDQWIAKGKQAQAQVQNFTSRNQQPPAPLVAQLEEAKTGVNDVNRKFDAFKSDNEKKRLQNMQAQASLQAQQQAAAGQNMQHQQVNGAQVQGMQRTASSGGQQANVKQEPRTSISPQQPQGSFQQMPQQQQNQTAAAQGTPGMPQQQSQQTPQTATQPQAPQNFPQQQQQYANQQRQNYPQMPQQPQQQQQQSMPQQQSQQSGPPQALTQQAAVAQAQKQWGQQAPQTSLTGQPHSNTAQIPPMPTPFNAANAHQNQSTPTSAYANQNLGPNISGGATGGGPNHKFPIPKQMTIDPRIASAVPGPAARPTMAGQGMLSQPGLGRPPPFTLEGEGEHVLSKRKLDELVRQVTGTATTTATDSDSSILSPEVEESVLALADDFIDDVVTAACKLAKLRPDHMLDMRDVQLVLERNYGIRIPGYTLEEVRTVRKFQPAPGWQAKMQAVQTAKTLGGVGGKGDV